MTFGRYRACNIRDFIFHTPFTVHFEHTASTLQQNVNACDYYDFYLIYMENVSIFITRDEYYAGKLYLHFLSGKFTIFVEWRMKNEVIRCF